MIRYSLNGHQILRGMQSENRKIVSYVEMGQIVIQHSLLVVEIFACKWLSIISLQVCKFQLQNKELENAA